MQVNHLDIVERVHGEHPPEHTIEGTVDFLVRVLAALPRNERAGMLRKDAGENIAQFHGVSISAGRVCYPDGQLYKIATDIPTTLAPEWLNDGPVEPSRYFDVSPFLDEPAELPAPIPFPAPPPPASAPEPEFLHDEFEQLFEAMARIVAGLEAVRDAIGKLDGTMNTLQQKGVAAHLRF